MKFADLDPLTQASIHQQGPDLKRVNQWRCGCSVDRAGRVWLCGYHAGYDDGVEAHAAVAE